jgi:hypothetical protein
MGCSAEVGLEIQLAWYSDRLRVMKVASVTAAEVAQGVLPSESWILNTIGEAMGFWVREPRHHHHNPALCGGGLMIWRVCAGQG